MPEVIKDNKLRESLKLLSVKKSIELLKQKDYDLIHNHYSWRFFLYVGKHLYNKTPIVTTHHGALSLDYQNVIFEQFENYPHISISNNQRKDFPSLNYINTVYNGINIDDYPLYQNSKQKKQNFMLFLARMSEQKGALEAAEVAHKLGIKLIVAAKVDTVDIPYYQKFKKYVNNKTVEFVGEIGFAKKLKLLQTAKLLIAPIKWEEPFGLMLTEAMSCGTPIVSFARGAAPEIIQDNKTGYLINQNPEFKRGAWTIKEYGIKGLSQAVQNIFNLNKEEYDLFCQKAHQRVQEKFSAKKMVQNYLATYHKLLNK